MNRIRIFVQPDDTPNSVFQQINRLYPDMKKDHDFIEIEITLFRGCNSKIIEEITKVIETSNLLEFRDRFYFDIL